MRRPVRQRYVCPNETPRDEESSYRRKHGTCIPGNTNETLIIIVVGIQWLSQDYTKEGEELRINDTFFKFFVKLVALSRFFYI